MPDGRRAGSLFARPFGKVGVIALAIVIVCGILAEVFYQVANMSGRSDRRGAQTWSAALAPVLAQSGSLAATLHSIRQLDGLSDRGSLVAALTALTTGTKTSIADFRSLGIPAASAADDGIVTDLLSDRSSAADLVSKAVLTSIAPGHGAADLHAAAGELAQAGTAMIKADRDAARISRATGPASGPIYTWVSSPPTWSVQNSLGFAGELSRMRAFDVRHALKIVALSINPAPLRISGGPTTSTSSSTSTTTTTIVFTSPSGPSGLSGLSGVRPKKRSTPTTVAVTTTTLQIPPPSSVSVLGPTTSVTPIIVIENVGDVTEQDIGIRASLTPRGRAPFDVIDQQSTRSLALLAPGRSSYVQLPSIPVSTKWTSYGLTVVVSDTDVASVTATVVLSVGS